MTRERRTEIEQQIKDSMRGLGTHAPLEGVTAEELEQLKLDWSTEVNNAVYQAALIMEQAEHAGLIYGNGHHHAQTIALQASQLFEKNWRPFERIAVAV